MCADEGTGENKNLTASQPKNGLAFNKLPSSPHKDITTTWLLDLHTSLTDNLIGSKWSSFCSSHFSSTSPLSSSLPAAFFGSACKHKESSSWAVLDNHINLEMIELQLEYELNVVSTFAETWQSLVVFHCNMANIAWFHVNFRPPPPSF